MVKSIRKWIERMRPIWAVWEEENGIVERWSDRPQTYSEAQKYADSYNQACKSAEWTETFVSGQPQKEPSKWYFVAKFESPAKFEED